jgi:hypothetical protein
MHGDMYIRKLKNGETYIQQGEVFVNRFMNSLDRDLERHGQGSLAGEYAQAVTLFNVKAGTTSIVKLSDLRWFYVQIDEEQGII